MGFREGVSVLPASRGGGACLCTWADFCISVLHISFLFFLTLFFFGLDYDYPLPACARSVYLVRFVGPCCFISFFLLHMV